MTLSDTLRKAIRDSGESINALAARAGMNQPTLSRFVNGHIDLTLGNASGLCRALKLRLAPQPKRRKRPRQTS